MSGLFITGTDTEVGKTRVTAGIYKALHKMGKKVTTQKWVQCGDLDGDDISFHDSVVDVASESLSHIRNPYRFDFPVSPHFAAELSGNQINPEYIKSTYNTLVSSHDWVLVEGAGGVLVPLIEGCLLIDVVAELGIPTLVVADNRVGCINHTLLTVESLSKRNVRCIGILLNESKASMDPKISENNQATIQAFSGIPVWGNVPHEKELSRFMHSIEFLVRRAFQSEHITIN